MSLLLNLLTTILVLASFAVYFYRDNNHILIENHLPTTTTTRHLQQQQQQQQNEIITDVTLTQLTLQMLDCNTTHGNVQKKLQTCDSRICYEPLPTPRPTKKIRDFSTLRFHLAHPLIQTCLQIKKTVKGGTIYLQYLDKSFVTMTKNWICNVLEFKTVLPRTVFVVTDSIAYDALTLFSKSQVEPKQNPPLNVVLVPFTPQQANGKDLDYGTLQYYDLMLFRSGIDWQLMANGIEFMTVESDAVWHKDPSDIIFSTSGDIITSNDRPPGEPTLISHGFSLFRNRPRVVELKLTILLKQEENFGATGDAGNEQGAIMELLAGEFNDLKLNFLSTDLFVNGLRFTDPSCSSCIVRQNNWVIGNQKKIERAKLAGFWYLKKENDVDVCFNMPRG
jgi:hypothetical protein